jgi:hypothetical protein
MYTYTSKVFPVGLEGFAQVDNDQITAMAADGWEPTHMTTVHNGFAAVVLFRREGRRPRAGTAPKKTGQSRTRVTSAKATSATRARPGTKARGG